ncbi:carboxyltransferase domain-containing protein [Vibrio sp. D420a]|uniref:5-oxoprolinase subunit B family protein n=1 Tax=Vibrio sp. D420a TaxID=2836895 RepID=UPI002552DEF9|nr:carboxyltransferase domain-containing protein [Vibrio sp. D420a]MDK9760816.1 carboxyltransferase domain-containing protein [Vibrio sp. D420a]
MKKPTFNVAIEPIAECSIMITLDLNGETRSLTKSQQNLIDPTAIDTPIFIAAVAQRIRQAFTPYLMNVTPAYSTILVDYLPYRVQELEFIGRLKQLISDIDISSLSSDQSKAILTIPTYYSKETALDLARFEQQGISLDQLVELHTNTIYQVSAVGFMPGFAFLSDVAPELSMPRHETPRLSVPKGSVGIADSKTAVYPDQSPGGWNLIGRSPLQLFNSKVSVEHLNEASFFNVGDQVKFEAISRQDFLDLGGCLND